MRADDVIAAVRRHYGAEHDSLGPEWAALTEFSLATGGGLPRIDLFLLRAWRSGPGHVRHAVEVKCSRSDLLAELRNTAKSAPFRRVAHEFYLAVPRGLFRRGDPIPYGWGVLEVGPHGVTQRRRSWFHADPDPLPVETLVEAFRRAARAEARIRDATPLDPTAMIAKLYRELNREQEAHERTRARLAATRVGGLDVQPVAG